MLVPQRDKLLQGTTLPDWGYEELKAKFQATAWWKDGKLPWKNGAFHERILYISSINRDFNVNIIYRWRLDVCLFSNFKRFLSHMNHDPVCNRLSAGVNMARRGCFSLWGRHHQTGWFFRPDVDQHWPTQWDLKQNGNYHRLGSYHSYRTANVNCRSGVCEIWNGRCHTQLKKAACRVPAHGIAGAIPCLRGYEAYRN